MVMNQTSVVCRVKKEDVTLTVKKFKDDLMPGIKKQKMQK